VIVTRVIRLAAAIAACDRWHSHHPPPIGGVFAVGAFDAERLVCVGVVGRPVSRVLQSVGALELTRVASDGTVRGAASAVVRACWREAEKRGCRRMVSYTLLGEIGACLRAARWRPVATVTGRQWSCPSRQRNAVAQTGGKVRWECGPDAMPRNLEVAALIEAHAGKSLPVRVPAQMELLK